MKCCSVLAAAARLFGGRRGSRKSSTPRASPEAFPPTCRSKLLQERSSRLQGSARRRKSRRLQDVAGRYERDFRSRREAGPIQASPRIEPEGRQHGDEDLPLRRRLREEREQVQLLPRRGRQACCSTGSNASPKPSGCTSTSNGPPSSTNSESTRRCCRSSRRYDRKRLVGVERFLPLLDRVAKNDTYLHMARERAAALADVFRNPKPKTTE